MLVGSKGFLLYRTYTILLYTSYLKCTVQSDFSTALNVDKGHIVVEVHHAVLCTIAKVGSLFLVYSAYTVSFSLRLIKATTKFVKLSNKY